MRGRGPKKMLRDRSSVSGARAAQNVDMRCLGFARDTDATLLAPYANDIFTDMRELPGLLEL